MSITRKIMAATLATSAVFGLAIVSTQPTTHVQARRYRYRRVIRRNWNRRCHTGYFRRGVWHRYATGHFSRSWRWIPNRRRVKHYHITLDGYTFNGLTKGIHGIKNGWTTNYRTYRQAENEIKAGVAQESRVDHISRRAAMRNLSNYGVKPRRAKRYHIGIGKYNIGWTTDYKFYKSTMRQLRHAMAIHNRNLAEEKASDNSRINNINHDINANANSNPQPAEPVAKPKKAVKKSVRRHGNFYKGWSANDFANQMKADEIQDINNDRTSHGLQPYTEDPSMDQVAQIRANQDAESHLDSNGQPATGPIAKRIGAYIPWCGYYAENLGVGYVGKEEPQTEGGECDTSSPARAVYKDNNGFMNRDWMANWGHRNGILSTDSTKMGVGVHCDKDQYGRPQWHTAEEFSY